MTMMHGVAANSQFQAALLVSIVVHVGLSVMTPSGVAQFDKTSVLPLAVRLIQREAMPVTQPAPSRSKSRVNHPAPNFQNTKPAPALVPPEPQNFFALPAVPPADLRAPQSSAAFELPAGVKSAYALPPIAAVETKSEGDSGNERLLDGYGQRLSEVLSRHQHYPRLARSRGWQGQVRLRLHLAQQGAVLDIEIAESSGYEVLDRQALEMVRLASPLPVPPDGMRGDKFTVDVPVTFRLEHS